MIRRISTKWSIFDHDDSVLLWEMRQELTHFFDTPHGRRETITPYKGFLIVRNTRTFTAGKPERCTKLYMFVRTEESESLRYRRGQSDVGGCG